MRASRVQLRELDVDLRLEKDDAGAPVVVAFRDASRGAQALPELRRLPYPSERHAIAEWVSEIELRVNGV